MKNDVSRGGQVGANHQLARLETLFKALADATRLRILRLLMAGEVCVCDIHDTLNIPQAKASRHLAYLRRAGLVNTRREGLWVHYRLAKSADPVIATIEEATTHVLGHVDTLRKDAQRFEKRTGCCVPAAGELGLACCAPAAKVQLSRPTAAKGGASGRDTATSHR
jgi:ArsR family transcriptional regulator